MTCVGWSADDRLKQRRWATSDTIAITLVTALAGAIRGIHLTRPGVIVFDETVSIPEALMVVARFYAHESCGQCTPCRESTGWIYKMTERILAGHGRKEEVRPTS